MAEVTIAKAYRNDVRISTRKVQIVLDLYNPCLEIMVSIYQEIQDPKQQAEEQYLSAIFNLVI